MPSVVVRPAIKARVNDRIEEIILISCTQRLMGAGRFLYTPDCETLRTALCEAVWDADAKSDERLDDGSTSCGEPQLGY